MTKSFLKLLDNLDVGRKPINVPELVRFEPTEIFVFGIVDGAGGDLAGEAFHR